MEKRHATCGYDGLKLTAHGLGAIELNGERGGRLGIAVVIDLDAANERDQLTALGALVCSFGVYRLSDQVDRHWIIPHLR